MKYRTRTVRPANVTDTPVASDAMMPAVEGWRRLRNADSALAYLRHAVLNRCRSVLRHRAVVVKHLPNPPPDNPSAEYGALVRLEQSAVVEALRRLPGQRIAPEQPNQRRPRGVPTTMQPPGTGIILKLSSSS